MVVTKKSEKVGASTESHPASTEKPSSQIDKEARLILRKWARSEFYVYLRPLTSKFSEPKKPFRVHWRVSVEMRGPWRQWTAEGYNLSEIIKECDQSITDGKTPDVQIRSSDRTPKEKAATKVDVQPERPRRRKDIKKGKKRR